MLRYVMSEKTFFFVKREIPLLFFVNCERADLFFVKRDLYPTFTTLSKQLQLTQLSTQLVGTPRSTSKFTYMYARFYSFPKMSSETILVGMSHCYQHWGDRQGRYSNKCIEEL